MAFLGGIALLCRAYHIGATDPSGPGYQRAQLLKLLLLLRGNQRIIVINIPWYL